MCVCMYACSRVCVRARECGTSVCAFGVWLNVCVGVRVCVFDVFTLRCAVSMWVYGWCLLWCVVCVFMSKVFLYVRLLKVCVCSEFLFVCVCVSLGVMCSCAWWECMWLVYVLSWRSGNHVCLGGGIAVSARVCVRAPVLVFFFNWSVWGGGRCSRTGTRKK